MVLSIPDSAAWLDSYLHELTIFPNGTFDDQADSTSQALDWYNVMSKEYGIMGYYRIENMTASGPWRMGRAQKA